MTDPRASRRLRHLLPGTLVHHNVHGDGRVVCEWGPIEVTHQTAAHSFASCDGVYDVVFGVEPHRYMHCCRAEYLQRVQ
jgi:hypothetical protein